MNTFFEILRAALGVTAGIGIGLGFGLIQAAAQRRNQKRENAGQFKSGWSVMPGSGARIAFLLITLVLVQIVCPALFADHTQWWVSGGVVAGYAWTLFRQLRHRRAACI